ncbi:MAG TPA: biotin--[acetyl-CoA-carboxylase] ligase [Methylomirabilota bacterium]|nr:biotin--[acetyl-CoA-carboxylase] ligase [Methylomirabilota bacterium]
MMVAAAAPPSIVRLGRVDSTQVVAFKLAAEGAADRTVVLAESQAGGRGRRGRAWHDEPGASLLASIILRPRLEPSRLATLSLTAAVAVAEALAAVAGLAPRLKWPNDVLVDGYKVAGILLESRLQAAPLVVLGIGVNVRQATFPPDIAARATSLRLATGRDITRDAVLTAVLDSLDRWRARLEREGFEPVRARWRALADTLGRPVSVDGVSGVAVDVDDDGALLVDDGTGRRRIVAGEIG